MSLRAHYMKCKKQLEKSLGDGEVRSAIELIFQQPECWCQRWCKVFKCRNSFHTAMNDSYRTRWRILISFLLKYFPKQKLCW